MLSKTNGSLSALSHAGITPANSQPEDVGTGGITKGGYFLINITSKTQALANGSKQPGPLHDSQM